MSHKDGPCAFGAPADNAGGKTLEEIARVLGVTRERVRQIEASAFRKIRRNPNNLKILCEAAQWARELRAAHAQEQPWRP